ncbi:hypothetical protein BKA62DRAFT_676868 [Auriculariales sp. MPI-PUGE-AT-0066]|nr:hypothetical protein BKA62DRAFT_676868 [Auriculariales sp. MPI-PUGE-AT-0066]
MRSAKRASHREIYAVSDKVIDENRGWRPTLSGEKVERPNLQGACPRYCGVLEIGLTVPSHWHPRSISPLGMRSLLTDTIRFSESDRNASFQDRGHSTNAGHNLIDGRAAPSSVRITRAVHIAGSYRSAEVERTLISPLRSGPGQSSWRVSHEFECSRWSQGGSCATLGAGCKPRSMHGFWSVGCANHCKLGYVVQYAGTNLVAAVGCSILRDAMWSMLCPEAGSGGKGGCEQHHRSANPFRRSTRAM